MKKNKIEVGQCYSYHDIVYMVIDGPYTFETKFWQVQNTLSKEIYDIPEQDLLTWHRPFANWVG
jgi:hypothetical protein